MKYKDMPPDHGESTGKLMGAQGCLAEIWPNPQERPSFRKFKELQLHGFIPFHRIGRRVFFDPAEVRRALDRKFRVEIA
jgi:hypothetical protein